MCSVAGCGGQGDGGDMDGGEELRPWRKRRQSTTSKLISQCFAPRVWGLRHSQCMCSVHVWVFHQGLNVQEDEMLVCARRVPLPSWSLFINSIVISFLSAQLLQTCH